MKLKNCLAVMIVLSLVWLVQAQEPEPVTQTESVSQQQNEPIPSESDSTMANGITDVMVIPVSDGGKYMVDQVQAEFIIKMLDEAEERGVGHVVLKIDTFGGVVFSAREITERLLRMSIPTTAYVETKAISAGAFIAWACDDIVMEELTSMGDAQMIMQTMEGIEVAPEKSVSVYRSDWKKASDAKGRSFALARGFFEQDLEVLQVGSQDDFEFILRQDYDLLNESERKPILSTVVPKGELLTLTAKQAEELGIVTMFPNFNSFLESIGSSEDAIDMADMDFNQQLLRFLGANPWLFFVLTLIGLNGIYMEIKAPGFGIPGLTALVCFTIVFGSRYLLGTAQPIELVLFGAGILLALVEIFVLPGFGISGILGILFMLGALVLASFPDFGDLPAFDLQKEWLFDLIKITGITFVVSFIPPVVLFPAIMSTPVAQRHLLPEELTSEEGYVVKTADEDGLLGFQGTAHSDLRPSGKVILDDGRYLDVVSDGHFVEKGQAIRVHKVDGNRIVVRPVSSSQA